MRKEAATWGPDATTPAELDAGRLAKLEIFRDLLIPAEADLPAATEVDRNARFIRRAWELVPRQAGLVARWLDVVDIAKPDQALRTLELEDAATFDALANLVFGAHLSNRKVWKKIGYPGRRPRLPYADEAESFLEDGILAPVEERGPFMRPVREPKGADRD